jgi:hypothetical protein
MYLISSGGRAIFAGFPTCVPKLCGDENLLARQPGFPHCLTHVLLISAGSCGQVRGYLHMDMVGRVMFACMWVPRDARQGGLARHLKSSAVSTWRYPTLSACVTAFRVSRPGGMRYVESPSWDGVGEVSRVPSTARIFANPHPCDS